MEAAFAAEQIQKRKEQRVLFFRSFRRRILIFKQFTLYALRSSNAHRWSLLLIRSRLIPQRPFKSTSPSIQSDRLFMIQGGTISSYFSSCFHRSNNPADMVCFQLRCFLSVSLTNEVAIEDESVAVLTTTIRAVNLASFVNPVRSVTPSVIPGQGLSAFA